MSNDVFIQVFSHRSKGSGLHQSQLEHYQINYFLSANFKEEVPLESSVHTFT